MEAFIVCTIIAAYMFVGGIIGRIILDNDRRKCPQWPATKAWREGKGSKPTYSSDRCDTDDHLTGFFAGLFWPLALPMFAGMWVGQFFSNTEERENRKDQRAEREFERRLELLNAETKRNESARKLVEDYQP